MNPMHWRPDDPFGLLDPMDTICRMSLNTVLFSRYFIIQYFILVSNTYYDRGLKVLFKGADSNLACHMTYGITHFVTSMVS